MDIQKNRENQMYGLKPVDGALKVQVGVFNKGRILLGRSESCDYIIDQEGISAIHAVLEIFEDRAIIYDMNSTNGTFVNGEKVVKRELRLEDVFSLGNFQVQFIKYRFEASLPPVLDTLEPERGSASVRLPDLPKNLPDLPKISEVAPSIIYPLAADPKADFSEYIFEDKDELYPIFKYEASKQAVEVIILFKDKIFSVDYLPEGKSTYYIRGIQSKEEEFEFPYLAKTERFPFVEIQKGGSAIVHTLPGFGIFHLSDTKKDTGHQGGSVELQGQDLVRLQKNDLQIFVRNVIAPPKVLHAPILKRDPEFRKYLLLCLLFLFFVSAGINLVTLPEVKKEEELAPERLATILYKKPVRREKIKPVVKATPKPEPVKKKEPPKKLAEKKVAPVKENKPVEKKAEVVTTKDQSKKPDPGKKTAPVKKIVKQGTEPVVKPTNKIAATPPAKSISTNSGASVPKTRTATTNSNAIGRVDVYKSADFKSSVSSLMAKGGSLSGVSTKPTSDGSSGAGFAGAVTGVVGGSGSVKSASFQTNQGSLVGAATGVLDDSKGAEGLSAKRTIYTAGIPSQTVVMGSMDPDIIRRILLEHLSQFRYCYQQELDKSGNEDVTGVIKLDFTIGASGHVAGAGVDSDSRIPAQVKKCVIGVLKAITFPEPLGGGTVGVKQPVNFYPKRLN